MDADVSSLIWQRRSAICWGIARATPLIAPPLGTQRIESTPSI
jgi:hypothetical protein